MFTCLEAHLIWFVFLHIYKILFLPFVKINVAFMHVYAAVAPFNAVYLSG